jgi:DNA-binding GntR family transcriptional regulator
LRQAERGFGFELVQYRNQEEEQMKSTRSDLVYDYVVKLIFNGNLLPRERILEHEIAAKLNVSKTPVREALNKLASDHLVESKGRLGSYVAKIPDANVVALYEARLVVEPPLAQWAAERGDSSEIAVLEQCFALQQEAFRNGDNGMFLEQDRHFHEFVASMARNPTMLQARRSISNQIALMQAISFLGRQRSTSNAVNEHEGILRAIQQRDGERAFEAMRIHIDNLLQEKKMMVARRVEELASDLHRDRQALGSVAGAREQQFEMTH